MCQPARTAPIPSHTTCGDPTIRWTVLSIADHVCGVTRFRTSGPTWSSHALRRSKKPANASRSSSSGGRAQSAL